MVLGMKHDRLRHHIVAGTLLLYDVFCGVRAAAAASVRAPGVRSAKSVKRRCGTVDDDVEL